MSKVTLTGYIIVPDCDIETVRKALPIHIELTRQEPGCLIFKVTPDALNPGRFDVYEEFVDQAAFESHQARVNASDWGRVTENIERFYQFL